METFHKELHSQQYRFFTDFYRPLCAQQTGDYLLEHTVVTKPVHCTEKVQKLK